MGAQLIRFHAPHRMLTLSKCDRVFREEKCVLVHCGYLFNRTVIRRTAEQVMLLCTLWRHSWLLRRIVFPLCNSESCPATEYRNRWRPPEIRLQQSSLSFAARHDPTTAEEDPGKTQTGKYIISGYIALTISVSLPARATIRHVLQSNNK